FTMTVGDTPRGYLAVTRGRLMACPFIVAATVVRPNMPRPKRNRCGYPRRRTRDYVAAILAKGSIPKPNSLRARGLGANLRGSKRMTEQVQWRDHRVDVPALLNRLFDDALK